MTDKPQNSGFKNLRAMFENQNSNANSPEPRGRSPAGRSNDDGSRPTSKVRASFVSVEPSGFAARELGTSKGADGLNSIAAHRRESFSISEDRGTETVAELKKAVSEEKEARKASEPVIEAIPEEAVETRESSRAPPPIRRGQTEEKVPNLGSIMKGADFPEPQVGQEQRSSGEKPETEQSLAPTTSHDTAADGLVEKMAAVSLSETPADNPDKATTGAQEEVSLKPADPKDEAAVSGGDALPPPAEVLPSANANEGAPATSQAEAAVPKSEGAQPEASTAAAPTPQTPSAGVNTPSKPKANGPTSTPKANGTTSAKKPAAISTPSAASIKVPAAKSPLPKSPGISRPAKVPTTPKAGSTVSPTKTKTTKEQVKPAHPKESSKEPVAKPPRASLKASAPASTAPTATKAKAPIAESKKPAPRTSAVNTSKPSTTSPTGFKKPRPKSPTRPVRLPSHLTAPTAASAAKHGEDAAQKPARKPATVSRPAPPKAAPAPTRKPRTSLASSTAPAKRPESRTSTRGGADEGFLARMMRPTASSASKTQDKPPASPPRRGASVKGPSKAKASHESTIAKGKRKVEEVTTKAKETLHTEHNDHEVKNGETPKEPDVAAGAQEPQADASGEPAVPTLENSAPVESQATTAVEESH